MDRFKVLFFCFQLLFPLFSFSRNFMTSANPFHLLRNLEFLDLGFNLIEGPIPLPSNSTRYFKISGNKFSGDVPSLICNATSLEILDLSNNHLSGRIPECLGNLSSLSVLHLQANSFHGPIPLEFAKRNALRHLNFNGNQLEGSLPQSLINCKSLEILDVGNNKMNDSFPHWLGSLPKLQVLVLRSNRFHGFVHKTKSKTSFPKLRIIDFSHNAFEGALPMRFFENLKSMMHVDEAEGGVRYMGDNYYDASVSVIYRDVSVSVTMKGREYILTRILTIFTAFDLSCNRFEGQIPETLGKFKSLKVLNFSRNSLSGHIPPSLENMTQIESLDLSSNKLVGEIPWQLTSLTFLGVLNLSHNLLEGPIPVGKQFSTFDNDSYIGNTGLCGFPLSKKCVNDEAPETQLLTNQEKEDDSSSLFDWKMAKIGYGSGLVIGVSLASIAFTIGRPRWLIMVVERIPRKVNGKFQNQGQWRHS